MFSSPSQPKQLNCSMIGELVRQSESLIPAMAQLIKVRRKPFTVGLPPQMQVLFSTKLTQKSILKAGRQIGKCVAADSPVHLGNGYTVPAHSIQVGDRLMSLDASFKASTGTVVDVISSGIKDCIKLTTRMGAELVVTPDHRLRTLFGYTRAGDLTVGDRLAHMTHGGQFGNLEISSQRIIFTAYMLGDGCCGLSSNFSFTTACKEQEDEITKIADEAGVTYRTYLKNGSTARSVCFSQASNGLKRWLQEDGCWGKPSYEKEIPAWVFDLSEQDTRLFLSRLWSTDGTLANMRTVEYCSTSKSMSISVQGLLRKLGIASTFRQKKCICNGERKRDAFIVRVEGLPSVTRFNQLLDIPGKPALVIPKIRSNNNRHTTPKEIQEVIDRLAKRTAYKHTNSMCANKLHKTLKYPPTMEKLDRYLEYFSDQKNTADYTTLMDIRNADVLWDAVIAIEPYGPTQTLDFEVEHDHNFSLSGVVSHNSTSQAGKTIMLSATIPFFQTLTVTPQFEMTRRYSNNYVRPLIDQSPIAALMLDMSCENNVLQRTFANQSIMHFSFALLDAERVRGVSSDRCHFDETQNINAEFIPEIAQTMGRSLYRIEDYTGTPKTFDNVMESLWVRSSQAEWLTPCACGYTNNPLIEADGLNMIGDKGIVCGKCGKPINPACGYWYHNKPEKINSFIGWHIPQIIMPFHYDSPANWSIIRRAKDGDISKRLFYNEIMGESCDVGAKLISETDLKNACVLPVTMNYHTARKLVLGYSTIALGLDWGGRGEDEISKTKAAVAGMRPDGRVDLLYAEDLSRLTDPGQEVARAIQLYNDFNCRILAHDAAGTAGMRDVLLSHARFPRDRVMPMSYVSAWSKEVVHYHEANDRIKWPHYSLDKTRSLLLTLECIKHGYLFFPAWESTELYLRDFLALVEEKSDSKRGSDVYLIRKAKGQCDDFAHAMNFCLLALFHHNNRYPDLVNVMHEFSNSYMATLEEMNKDRAMKDWVSGDPAK